MIKALSLDSISKIVYYSRKEYGVIISNQQMIARNFTSSYQLLITGYFFSRL
jgi:hypothetical protein